MRWTIATAALLVAFPAWAHDVAVESEVFLETTVNEDVRRVAPADRLRRGDRVVTVLRWDAPRPGSYTAVSPVPPGLVIESASGSGIETSSDGGHSWRRLADPDVVPRGTTHLRWRLASGAGRLSYRAIVR